MSNHEMWVFNFVSEYTDTPLKSKMEPENHHHFEKENHLPKPHWWVPAVVFSEGTVSDVDLHQILQ